MKNIYKITSIIIVLLLLNSACSEDFLEVENRTNLALSSFLRSATDVEYAVNSCYYGLSGRGMHGNQWYLLFNSYSDRIIFETEARDKITINSSDGGVSAMFQDLYIGLYRTSQTLAILNEREIPDLSAELKSRYKAEAYTLQAAYLFHLVTIFDQPYYYDETSVPGDPETVFPNGEREQFWDKIEDNLVTYRDSLPESYPETEIGKVTRGMANALLGKALLYKHYHYYARFGNEGSADDLADLATAREAFSNVMNGPYELVQPQEPLTNLDYIYAHHSNFCYVDLPSENNVYVGENTSESVWMIMYHDDYYNNLWLPAWMSAGHRNSEYFGAHPSSYRNHTIHPYMWLEWETSNPPAGFDRDPRAYSTCYLDGDILDFRPEASYYNAPYKSGLNNKPNASDRGITIPDQPTGEFGLKKYFFPVYNEGDAPLNSPTNRNYIRFADVLLMYAEVQFLTGDDGTGLEALNRVRRRVGMQDIAGLTAEAIIHERDVELCTEGHRFLDLIRWSFDSRTATPWEDIEWGIDENNSVNPFVVGKNEYLPIPLREIDLSRGELVQNPGW